MNRDKKKVVINGGMFQKDLFFGIHRYTIEILKELDKIISSDIKIYLLLSCDISVEFNNIKKVVMPFYTKRGIRKYIWNYYIFPKYAKKYHCFSIDMLMGFPLFADVITIYDCISELYSINANTIYKKVARIIYLLRVKFSIMTCKYIFTISECSKKDIINYYKIKNKLIYILPCAWQHFENIIENENILEKLKLNKCEYFFSLGTRFAHKNFRWVVEAAKQNQNYIFVVSGSKTQNSSDHYIENTDLNNIIFTDYLSDGEVKALMRYCKAFIFPSLYEGFGMPPLEALSAGAEIIISNSSCLPDIYENSAHYIDPLNYNDINIEKILSTRVEDARKLLDKYSWNLTANKFYKFIKNYI